MGSKAARITEEVPPGGIHVLKGYGIHEEQIANVAKNLKELYHTRRTDPWPPGSSGKGNENPKKGKAGVVQRLRACKTIWETGPVEGPVTDHQEALLPIMGEHGSTVTAIRCLRCGVNFPVADFHYTNKSGLCIDCWEELVV